MRLLYHKKSSAIFDFVDGGKDMKNVKRKFLPVAMLALGVGALAGCGETPTPEPPYIISEKAMNNFLTKIQAGNYTMVGGDQTTTVKDQTMVTWFFPEGSTYTDHVAITVNQETYYAFIDEDKQSLEEMTFLDKEDAMYVTELSYYLPTYWLSDDMAKGNIWTLFHNNQTNPLHFDATQDLHLYMTICYFSNLDANETPTHMQDVYMEFDSVDVHQAFIHFKYNPGGTAELQDGLVTLTFDEDIRTSDIALAWANDPNREYPKPIGEYGSWRQVPGMYYSDISSVYKSNLGYLDDVDPYPYDDFFSYATKIDDSKARYHGIIEVTDFHADEDDARQYMNTLISHGYQAATGVTGMVFRSPKARERNGYYMFSDITFTLDPDNGLTISGSRYYSSTTYSGRDTINSHIQAASTKYFDIPESDNITSVRAVDSPFAAYESKGAMYDVNLYLTVSLAYKDSDTMDTYLNNYFQTYLDNGFVYNDKDGTYTKADQTSKTVIKLDANDSNVATLLFTNEDRVLPSIGFPIMQEAGFPEINIDEDKVDSILDINGYERLNLGQIWTHYYWVTVDFASHDELLAFVNPYKDALVANGFEEQQEEVRTCRYTNDDLGLLIVMDYKATTSTFNAWFGIE